MISTLFELRNKIDTYLADPNNNTISDPTRLELIRQNNIFVTETFYKVQQNIARMIQ